LCRALPFAASSEVVHAAARFTSVWGAVFVVGPAVGIVFAALNKRVRETRALFVLSLVSPYLAALLGIQLGVSAVLAVVVAGVFVAPRGPNIPPGRPDAAFAGGGARLVLPGAPCVPCPLPPVAP